MTDTELQGVVDTLRAQRNGALDAIAQLNGTIAELQEKLVKQGEELADANMKLTSPPLPHVTEIEHGNPS